ncbi:hypothetical protein CBM2586_B30106 [Cupriavidus phytorum]|uniref:Uncharacterized protein n=1 Tax=Cupriavidus taiwanensis TaxID=164546 RepID=A0A975XJV2_9BURK|nr:hypothetical protein CBM2586_B30106 [Cupriavidus taiwanensis]
MISSIIAMDSPLEKARHSFPHEGGGPDGEGGKTGLRWGTGQPCGCLARPAREPAWFVRAHRRCLLQGNACPP